MTCVEGHSGMWERVDR